MIGKGVSGERFQPRTCSGKSAPKTGRAKEYSENVVIDIDGDQVDDVVIIDFPDYVQQKLHGSSVQSRDRKCPLQSVISIDDDDESDEGDQTEIIAEGGGELDSDASSSKRCSAPGFTGNSVHLDIDDCPDIFEKGSSSKLPESRKSSSTQAADRNRYGLDSSESESSESDCSDCELMEVCEQWEKAFKRRRHTFNDHARFDEQASSSGLHRNSNADIEIENRTRQDAGTSLYSGSSNGKCAVNLAHMGNNKIDDVDLNREKEYPCKDSGQKIDQESYKFCTFGSTEKSQSLHQNSHSQCEEMTRSEEFRPCAKSKSYDVASEFNKEAGDKDSKFMRSTREENKRQIESDGSGLRNRDFPDTHNSCASFDEIQPKQDGFASQECCVRDIINEREKLKETDEYKQAIEEEWASRQRQLQIQAEEAQRLRKRKKAESKRLLDMQRRQKERIEEVRETQKKDEENMNIKEQLRNEIRKELNKLEITCVNMASLLRGLGIQVGGGFSPLPKEVHAAYKQALLRFHPDRASKTDIRQQVEAEEKFKLISRMKEKFLIPSCF
ncbi:uncharacterized protein LOC114720428 [Neltuma alba]|uniref:uncharacterized protein LOC114720428 n=1 Tax=Neltuma alba TaxID=207710 RepID=UPI0010A37690|nr:uncharacterized protein LOC114720428 [Prosopis alba]XP_028761904.1 uncharacterized protein LOC114720428 [Prosopis alba]XP_028761905.1 uncharacterized protein LOC114720428 [Prosopis alba]XP_028761906.1 uncharacterized protein LOC114720428 [Prosopis alba]